MNRKYIKAWMIGFLNVILLQTLCYSQSESSKTPPEKHIQFNLAHFRSGLDRLFTSKDNLYYLGGGTAATLLALPIDDSINDKFGGNKDIHTDLGSILGRPYVLGGVSLLTFIAGRISDTPHLANTGIYLIESLAATYAVTILLKVTVHRERPDRANNLSFPSGHTSGSFAFAGVLDRRYGWEIGVPAYLFASAVGVSRIRSSRHYLSDVLAGASIGLSVGTSLALPRGQAKQLSLQPTVGWRMVGIFASLKF